MPRIIAHLERYIERFHLPVRYGVRVERVERNETSGLYLVWTSDGGAIIACNVVVATGLYQAPKVPTFSAALAPNIRQVHSDAYRNPTELFPGAVLVVGSAQSGAQIAEELYEAGKKVYLAVGRSGRVPRRYRGKDANWWSEKLGLYDRTVDQLSSPRAKFAGKPHISGTKGGHTINLHEFARAGVTLLGHLQGVERGKLNLAPDLWENLAGADVHEAAFVKSVDDYIARTGMVAPEETLPVLRDGFRIPLLTELDLGRAGLTNIIWATSYAFDFSLVKLQVLDKDGFPIQAGGGRKLVEVAFAFWSVDDPKAGLAWCNAIPIRLRLWMVAGSNFGGEKALAMGRVTLTGLGVAAHCSARDPPPTRSMAGGVHDPSMIALSGQ
jgi:putative flavoprotein involved in K+ transport